MMSGDNTMRASCCLPILSRPSSLTPPPTQQHTWHPWLPLWPCDRARSCSLHPRQLLLPTSCHVQHAWVQPPSCFRGTHPCWPEQLPAQKVSMQAGVPARVPQGLACPHCLPCMHHRLPSYWVPHVTHSKHAGSQHLALVRAALSNARTHTYAYTHTPSHPHVQ